MDPETELGSMTTQIIWVLGIVSTSLNIWNVVADSDLFDSEVNSISVSPW